jgi:hypothetical protein
MAFMNFVRDLFAAPPAPADASSAPGYGYGESQPGYPPYGATADTLQTVAGGGFAEGFGNDLLVAAPAPTDGLAFPGGGGWGAPAPATGLEWPGGGGWGAPAPAGAPDNGYAASGMSTDMGYLLQNVATVTADAPAPAFDGKLNWAWG